jgi:rhamnosyltransferase subunit B
VPIGSHGDVHPIVGLALAMQRRGHKVAVATNGYFRHLIEANRLEFIELGGEQEYLEATSRPELWHSDKGAKVVFSYAIKYLRPVYKILLQRWQQVILPTNSGHVLSSV